MNARPSISAEQHFLSEAIEPIRPFLDDPGVVEISCQRSNEIWLERIGQLSMMRQQVDGLDQESIRHMASRAASFTKQTVNAEHPLLSATLVNGERVQFVLNPTSATGHAFSIRKQFIRRFDLNDYEKAGAFRFTKVTETTISTTSISSCRGCCGPARFAPSWSSRQSITAAC
jgi:type IV secretion system protein VirB11